MSSNIPSPEAFRGELLDKPASAGTSGKMPDVTVVTVCFNPLKEGRRELLAMNLDSVQRQEGLALEHLFIDGASSDGTLDFLMSYSNRSHDIRVLSKPDTGIYEAMNRGIALARGKYVAFLNSDDHYHCADGLAASMKALEESRCGFTFAPVLPQGPHTRFTHYHHPQRRLHKLFVTSVLPHPSMLYSRTALMEMGGYDTTYSLAADYDLTLRLVAKGYKSCFVDCCFATFVVGGVSTQEKNRDTEAKEKKQIVRNAHRNAFGTELSWQESETLVAKGVYPRRYLSLYVESQRFLSEAFCRLPNGLAYRIVRRFNFWKYYLKCLLSG